MTPEQANDRDGQTLWVFPKYSRNGASSRLRIYQFLPILEGAGFDPTVSPLFDDAYLERLYAKQKTSAFSVLKYYLRRARALLSIKRGDVVLVQGELFPWLPSFVEAFFLRDTRLILDFDDAIFHRYDLNKLWLIRLVLGRKIDKLMRTSKLVVAGNRYLGDRAERAGAAKVEWLPTVVDIDRYSTVTSPEASAPVVIGWIGTPITWASYGEALFQSISDALADENVEFLVVGASKTEGKFGRIEFSPWTEYTEAQSIARMSVGLMPLDDSPWARGKCGYKLIQYLACGVPVIASPVGANLDIVEEGINGFFAESTADWAEAVAHFTQTPESRREMGTRGREMVRNNYSIQRQGPRLVQMIQEVFDH
ncbi:glycosyltransferase family 4 protein [Sulfitobacter pontiacus]|uniref:glycosyltransferase family 4 protein n=1 Tax=Sulfitobacter pontiacus TaxID=60137 RepID=UPI0015DFBC20|nr:glycosyltransferase family 4 protein [Sulfitobacter pontiacus]QLL44319.1 glycosyltransferase family 4 protein [Sulfitobacter pontiacus]